MTAHAAHEAESGLTYTFVAWPDALDKLPFRGDHVSLETADTLLPW
jgi:hypothetical protein